MNRLYKLTKEGIVLEVKVIPRASRNEIVGILDDRLKLKIKSPPLEGRANKEIVNFFSSFLNMPKRDIEILRGTTSSHKSILFYGKGKDVVEKIISYLKERRE